MFSFSSKFSLVYKLYYEKKYEEQNKNLAYQNRNDIFFPPLLSIFHQL